jgi:hypothetical protein
MLQVSIPTEWLPALLGQGTGHMPACDRTAFRRWANDMRAEFGTFHVADIYTTTCIDTAHEGTEYGMRPWTRCQTVALAFDA